MQPNGILSLPGEQYHSADGVSKSMLDWIAPPNTPAHFEALFITKVIEYKDTEAKTFGSLSHRVLLEPDTLEGAFYVEPKSIEIGGERLSKLASAKVLSKFDATFEVAWNNAYGECKKWYADHEDRPVITEKERATAFGIRDAIWRHPMAKRLLHKAEAEKCLFATDGDGVLRKGRLDALTLGSAIPDLKTCLSAHPEDVSKMILDYRYHVQAAYYIDLCNLLGMDKRDFVLIAVEKSQPYLVACYRIDPEIVELGRREYKRDLAVLRHCRETNQWPGYPWEILDVRLPDWAMRKLESEGVQ